MNVTNPTFNEVREILTKTLGIEDRVDSLTSATPLLDSVPEFDSMAVLKVILAIEEHFGLTIEGDEVTGELFETLGTLSAFVEEKINESEGDRNPNALEAAQESNESEATQESNDSEVAHGSKEPNEHSRMTVSILIVNWNSKDLLRQCLLSIRRTCVDLAPEIVVVDSGSFDGCAEMLAREFPEVEFVQSNDNIGFARANNLGLTRVTGEAVWVLNPDTELTTGALQTLLDELERLPDAGIVSPRLLNTDLTLQSSVHALPKPVRQAFDSKVLRRALSPYDLWAPPSDFAPPGTVAVEAVPGTAMLIRTQIFRSVGGFTPDYFMYAEDMDLCFKVLRAGYRIYHVPASKVIHHGGASSAVHGSSFAAVMIREALHAYMILNHGRQSARTYRLATGVSALTRLLVLAPGLVVGDEQHRLVRKAAFEQYRSVLSWSCGGQKWTKRYFAPEPGAQEPSSAGG
jgi:GT2 family glycosyltransferase/acyl carrier protein